MASDRTPSATDDVEERIDEFFRLFDQADDRRAFMRGFIRRADRLMGHPRPRKCLHPDENDSACDCCQVAWYREDEAQRAECVHDFRTIEDDDQAGEELVKCKRCGIEQTHVLRTEQEKTHEPPGSVKASTGARATGGAGPDRKLDEQGRPGMPGIPEPADQPSPPAEAQESRGATSQCTSDGWCKGECPKCGWDFAHHSPSMNGVGGFVPGRLDCPLGTPPIVHRDVKPEQPSANAAKHAPTCPFPRDHCDCIGFSLTEEGRAEVASFRQVKKPCPACGGTAFSYASNGKPHDDGRRFWFCIGCAPLPEQES